MGCQLFAQHVDLVGLRVVATQSRYAVSLVNAFPLGQPGQPVPGAVLEVLEDGGLVESAVVVEELVRMREGVVPAISGRYFPALD